MVCDRCKLDCQRFGTHRNGLRRFRCPICKKTYTESHNAAIEGSYIAQDRVVLALRLLLEGNSIRSTERITNLDRNTIMKILVKAGQKCEQERKEREGKGVSLNLYSLSPSKKGHSRLAHF